MNYLIIFLHYLIYQLKNEPAAIHLLDEINTIYDRMEENPLHFRLAGIHI